MTHFLRMSVLRQIKKGRVGISILGPLYLRQASAVSTIGGGSRYRIQGYQRGWFTCASGLVDSSMLGGHWSSDISEEDGQ